MSLHKLIVKKNSQSITNAFLLVQSLHGVLEDVALDSIHRDLTLGCTSCPMSVSDRSRELL